MFIKTQQNFQNVVKCLTWLINYYLILLSILNICINTSFLLNKNYSEDDLVDKELSPSRNKIVPVLYNVNK